MTINTEHSNVIDIDDGWTSYAELRPFNHTTNTMQIVSGGQSASISFQTLRELVRFLDAHACTGCGGLIDHGCVCEPA